MTSGLTNLGSDVLPRSIRVVNDKYGGDLLKPIDLVERGVTGAFGTDNQVRSVSHSLFRVWCGVIPKLFNAGFFCFFRPLDKETVLIGKVFRILTGGASSNDWCINKPVSVNDVETIRSG